MFSLEVSIRVNWCKSEMKWVLIFAGLVGYAFANCPRVATVPNLDLANYMGSWQIHGIVNTSKPIGEIKCYMSMLSGENFEDEPVEIGAHLMGSHANGDMFMTDVAVKVNFLLAPGYWEWNENGVISTAFVMFTDYIEYSLLLICRSNGDELEVHFMSRVHDPMPETIVNKFKAQLEEYGIPVDNYKSIFHDHSCGHHY